MSWASQPVSVLGTALWVARQAAPVQVALVAIVPLWYHQAPLNTETQFFRLLVSLSWSGVVKGMSL